MKTKRRIRTPVAIVGIVFGTLLLGCGIQSIDSVKDKQLNICKTIRDEKIRTDCVVRVNEDKP